jgi:hypothetical protein
VRVAVWIRETGSGPPTHVGANIEPAASRVPPKALASPARGAPHTDEFGSLEPEPSRTRIVWAPSDRAATVVVHLSNNQPQMQRGFGSFGVPEDGEKVF